MARLARDEDVIGTSLMKQYAEIGPMFNKIWLMIIGTVWVDSGVLVDVAIFPRRRIAC